MPEAPTARLEINPALLQRLRGIDLRSRFLVRGLYHSRHRTNDFGSSTEFIEHREYRWGDELRTIDWRVYARTDRFYVKVHEMEANMRVYCMVDASASMRVPPPSGLPSKLELAATIAGAIAMMTVTQQDAIGLACLSDAIDEQIPARQGNNHLALLYQHLGNPKGGTGAGDFGALVRQATHPMGVRAMVFLLTDALDDPEQLFTAMKQLRARQQDVTLIQILDRQELEFPFDRLTEFRHPETGQRLIGQPVALRNRYLERLNRHLAQVTDYAKRAQADYVRITNSDDLTKLMSLHFLRRLMWRTR